MARNKVRVKSIEILNAGSLLSTDIFVYTQKNPPPQVWLVLVSSQWTKYPNPMLGQDSIWGGKSALQSYFW